MTAKKKLAGAFGGVVAIGATVALTAGTFSYFSDSATVKGGSGTVEFGTLELELLEGAAAENFAIDNAAPGSTVVEKTDLLFHNAGSMAGELRIKFVADNPKAKAFNDAVLITVYGVPGFTDGVPTPLTEAVKITKDGGHLANTFMEGEDDGIMYKGISFAVSIDPNAGNALQGTAGGFTLEADLVQSNDGEPAYPAPAFPADES